MRGRAVCRVGQPERKRKRREGRARVECRGMRRQLVRASAVGDDVAVT